MLHLHGTKRIALLRVPRLSKQPGSRILTAHSDSNTDSMADRHSSTSVALQTRSCYIWHVGFEAIAKVHVVDDEASKVCKKQRPTESPLKFSKKRCVILASAKAWG